MSSVGTLFCQYVSGYTGSNTYLVDHLRWLERECLAFDTVQVRDLERYMGIVGAGVRMPLGEPWRVGKRPYVGPHCRSRRPD